MGKIDLTGQRFDRLVAIKFLYMEGNHSVWECWCDCGKACHARLNNLRTKHTRSCGCLAEETKLRTDNKITVHEHVRGKRRTPTYQSWRCMVERCRDKSNASYAQYGARGISVCERWKDFRNFLADMGERPPECTIDRINPELGYFPENCRWATWDVQVSNRRKKAA